MSHYRRHRQLGSCPACGLRLIWVGGRDDDLRLPGYAGYCFPAEVISHAGWLYFRFPLSLRMVDELLAARGIVASQETVRQWALKFGQTFANQIRRRLGSRHGTGRIAR